MWRSQQRILEASPVYGDFTTIKITLASLATAGYRQSDYIDNSTLKYIDALVGGRIVTGAVAPTLGSTINVFCYGLIAEPGGTAIYTAGASGIDAAYTAAGEQNLLGVLKSIQVDTDTDTSYRFGPCSVCDALGVRVLPKFWGIIVSNGIGQALNATESNHAIGYYGVK